MSVLELTAARAAEQVRAGELSPRELFDFYRERAAAEGAVCSVHARLREVADGRKLRFDVEVREGDRTIGVGTHERRAIDIAAHAQQGGGGA